MFRATLINAVPLFTALLGAAQACACEGLAVEAGWVREPPPGSEVTAGFMRFANHGGTSLTIDGIKSSCCADVMIHRTERHGDTMHMSHQDALNVAPGKSVTLAPGGLHLMIMGLNHPLKAGAMVDFEFSCGGRPTRAAIPVRADEP